MTDELAEEARTSVCARCWRSPSVERLIEAARPMSGFDGPWIDRRLGNPRESERERERFGRAAFRP
jgi:hypothetical protein